MKNLIIVTGGAGFVGSNLIDLLLKKTKFFQFFILVNLQEYFKALKNLMNVTNQIQLAQKLYLNFV